MLGKSGAQHDKDLVVCSWCYTMEGQRYHLNLQEQVFLGLVMNVGRLAGGVAFVAGAGAAIGSGIVKVPLAVCVRSVQAGAYPNAFAAAKAIVDSAGVRSLFTVSLCLLRMKA